MSLALVSLAVDTAAACSVGNCPPALPAATCAVTERTFESDVACSVAGVNLSNSLEYCPNLPFFAFVCADQELASCTLRSPPTLSTCQLLPIFNPGPAL